MDYDNSDGEKDDRPGIEADDVRLTPGKKTRTRKLSAPDAPAARLAHRMSRLREVIASASDNLGALANAITARDYGRACFAAEWVRRHLQAIDDQLAELRARRDESRGHAAELMVFTGQRAELFHRGAALLEVAPGPEPAVSADMLADAVFDPARFAALDQARAQRHHVWLARLDGSPSSPSADASSIPSQANASETGHARRIVGYASGPTVERK